MATGTRSFDAEVVEYFAALHRGDRRSATGLALGLLEAGVPAEDIISGLIARGQVMVGLGWQEGSWTVAMEHRASNIAESVLTAVAETAMMAPNALPEGSRGVAVVACTEGEWHVLPGRLASETLRLRGVDVTFIGPSVPAADLADILGQEHAPVVALSCSMQMSLAGAWRSITALRAVGILIVCGGRGFGPQGRWGLALGADQWAPDFASGADLVSAGMVGPTPGPRPPQGDPAAIAEVGDLERDFEAIIEQGIATALGRWPGLADSPSGVRATREDLASTLRAVQSAVIVGDQEVLATYITWFESVLAARGLPLSFVPGGLALLLEVLPSGYELMRGSARDGLTRCTARVAPA